MFNAELGELGGLNKLIYTNRVRIIATWKSEEKEYKVKSRWYLGIFKKELEQRIQELGIETVDVYYNTAKKKVYYMDLNPVEKAINREK